MYLVDNTSKPGGTGHITKKNVGPEMHYMLLWRHESEKERTVYCSIKHAGPGGK